MMTLKENIIFKFIAQENKIALFDALGDSNILINIISKDHATTIYSLISRDIIFEEFLATVKPEVMADFIAVTKELENLGLIQSEKGPTPSSQSNLSSTIFMGKHMALTKETMEHEVYAPTYSEGEACSPEGMTYCETNSGNANFPRELWQCISGPPSNWAAMGQSC